jgi:transcriptional regulator with XRE-family HTH domain
MEFGPWLKIYRRDKLKYDLKTVSKLTGVDASTISRIENQKTQATLDTVIRICDGLEIDFTYLIRELMGTKEIPTVDYFRPQNEIRFPTIDYFDLDRFLDRFRQSSDWGCHFLAQWITQVAANQAKEDGLAPPPPITDTDIAHMLTKSSVYEFRLHYPAEHLFAEDIFRIFQNGGVLIFADVGSYVREIRRARNTTLASLHKSTERSTSVLSRVETGALERIKLDDVLAVNEQLSGQNEILGMFWAAAQGHVDSQGVIKIGDWIARAYDLTILFVTLCRWLYVQNRNDTNWVRQITDELATSQ